MCKAFVASWLALGALLLAPRASAADSIPTRVLVIHQYSMDMPFRVAFDPALQKALRAAIPGQLEIYSEVLELYRFPAPDHSQLMRRFFREKYRGRSIDVVVAVYDTALEFVRTYHDELFPGVPIVSLTTRLLEPKPGEPVTGIWTGSSLAATVSLALQLHPGARHLYVVESALRNLGAYQEAARSLHEFEPRVSIMYLRDRPLGEVESTLRAAPADSLVLYLRQMIGANGETIDQANGLSHVLAASSLPVYGTTQTLVGAGLIGGYVSSVEGNAARVADLARRVASGTPPTSITPSAGVIVPYFDWRELRRHGLAEGGLPAGSHVLFKEPTFWSQYRNYVLAAALVFMAQAVLIGALLVHRRRRQNAELALQRSEARNKATLRAVPDLMFLFDKEGCVPRLSRTRSEPADRAARTAARSPGCRRDAAGTRLDVHARARAGEPRRRTARCRVRADAGWHRASVRSPARRVRRRRRHRDEPGARRDRSAARDRGRAAEPPALRTGDQRVWRRSVGLESGDAGFLHRPRIHDDSGYEHGGPKRFEGLVEYVHPHDRPATEAAARACLDGMTATYAQEHRMVCRDGSIRWFQCRGTVLSNGDGRAARLVGTFWDITERREAEAALRMSELALRATNAEIQDLAGRLIAAQEEERARIARDLHDDMGQKLALLTIDIEQLGRRGSLADDTADHVRQISDRAAEIASDMHRMSYQLHPTKLEALGLVPSIQSVCRDVSNQHDVQVEFRHQFVPPDLDPEISLCLFRIVQESLRNVVRHSGARRALVHISGSDGELQLQVADQGRGFDVEGMARAGLGLVSMRERVKFVGGEIVIRSAPSTGTRIGVRVPCAVARSADQLVERGARERSKTA